MSAMLLNIIFVLVSILATGDKTYYLYEVRNAEPFTIYGCGVVESGSWFGSPTLAKVMPDKRDGAAGGGWHVPDPYRYFYIAADSYHPQPVIIESADGGLRVTGPGCFLYYMPRYYNYAN